MKNNDYINYLIGIDLHYHKIYSDFLKRKEMLIKDVFSFNAINTVIIALTTYLNIIDRQHIKFLIILLVTIYIISIISTVIVLKLQLELNIGTMNNDYNDLSIMLKENIEYNSENLTNVMSKLDNYISHYLIFVLSFAIVILIYIIAFI